LCCALLGKIEDDELGSPEDKLQFQVSRQFVESPEQGLQEFFLGISSAT